MRMVQEKTQSCQRELRPGPCAKWFGCSSSSKSTQASRRPDTLVLCCVCLRSGSDQPVVVPPCFVFAVQPEHARPPMQMQWQRARFCQSARFAFQSKHGLFYWAARSQELLERRKFLIRVTKDVIKLIS